MKKNVQKPLQTKQPVYNAVQNVDNTTFTIDYVPVIVGDKAAGVVHYLPDGQKNSAD